MATMPHGQLDWWCNAHGRWEDSVTCCRHPSRTVVMVQCSHMRDPGRVEHVCETCHKQWSDSGNVGCGQEAFA